MCNCKNKCNCNISSITKGEKGDRGITGPEGPQGIPGVMVNGWKLNGNSEGVEKYFGTNDNFDIPIYTNNVLRGVFDKSGNFGFGISSSLLARVHVKGTDSTSSNYAFKADSSSVNTFGIKNDGIIEAGVASISSLKMGHLVGAYGSGTENNSFGYRTLTALTSGSRNSCLGAFAGTNITSGNDNSAFGYSALITNTTSSNNSAFGRQSLYNNIGADNTAFGLDSMYSNTSGGNNAGFGRSVLNFNTTGSNNTGLGTYSGYTNNGSNNVFIGFSAGYNRTADSNKLFIDNQDRGTAANELVRALVYGEFNSTAASQLFRINAGFFELPLVQVGNAGLTSGQTYFDTAANILANADLILARKV